MDASLENVCFNEAALEHIKKLRESGRHSTRDMYACLCQVEYMHILLEF